MLCDAFRTQISEVASTHIGIIMIGSILINADKFCNKLRMYDVASCTHT